MENYSTILQFWKNRKHHILPVYPSSVKKWIEVENFSGKSVLSVYQDFHAKVFSKNLTSAIAFPRQATIDENNRHSLHKYQKSFVQVVSKVKDVRPLLFIRARSKILTKISDLHAIVEKRIEPLRPGRENFREISIMKNGIFRYGYKPLR
jgi:hypothetical protein